MNNEIQFLATKIPGYYQLTKDERLTAISDSHLSLIKKELDFTDYENYKNYMFITVKNMVLRQFTKRKYYKNQILINSLEINEIDDIEEKNDKKDIDNRILELINNPKMTNYRREIINLLLDGYSNRQIATHLGKSLNTIHNMLFQIRKIVADSSSFSNT